MEKWDLYDKDFNKLNRFAYRGDTLADDEFHLVINAWIINDNNEFLITQRCANKSHPFMWECTGGSASFGESDLDACAREIKEELGIDINLKTAKFIGQKNRYYKGCPDILRVYLFRDNTPLNKIKIQEDEVMNVMWATKEEILELYKNSKFEANAFFNEVLNMV